MINFTFKFLADVDLLRGLLCLQVVKVQLVDLEPQGGRLLGDGHLLLLLLLLLLLQIHLLLRHELLLLLRQELLLLLELGLRREVAGGGILMRRHRLLRRKRRCHCLLGLQAVVHHWEVRRGHS